MSVDSVTLPVLVVGASLAAVLVLVWDGRRSAAPSDAARRALRHVTWTSTAAVVPMCTALIAVAAFPVLYGSTIPSRILAAVPVIALLAYLAALVVGELTWPRPSGEVRVARLAPRTVVDVAPSPDRHLVRALACTAVGTAGVLALIASGPRSVSRVTGPYESFTSGPFPGWLWGLPLVGAVIACLLAVEAVLRVVAARQALAAVDEGWDLWLRRKIARRALRCTQLVFGLLVAGLLLVAGVGLRGVATGENAAHTTDFSPIHESAGWSLMAAAGMVAIASLVLSLRPARDAAPAAPTMTSAAEAA